MLMPSKKEMRMPESDEKMLCIEYESSFTSEIKHDSL